jgi:hypothetical protein
MLERHEALHVFGYTARHDKSDPIAAALIALVRDYPDKFCVRFSNAPYPFDAASTISIEHPYQRPPDAIQCPTRPNPTGLVVLQG